MAPVLTHLALHVRDLNACIEFYREWFDLEIVHERGDGPNRVVWLGEPRKQQRLILVFIPGGPGRDQQPSDFSHLGFSVDNRTDVDSLAAKASAAGCQAWPVRDEPYPVGYYFGMRDPDGNIVEISTGQPIDLTEQE